MPTPSRSRLSPIVRCAGALTVALLLLGASAARAEDEVAKVAKLNKLALDAFDNLNFDQAKLLLEQGLTHCDSAGLTNDPIAARTHLNLGMLLIAGFQQRDQAIEHFKAALKVQPDITPPAGLFNPEVQTAFDEVKTNFKAEPEPPKPSVKSKSGATPEPGAAVSDFAKGEEEGEEEEAPATTGSPIFLSLGLGSGFGVAKGHLDANKDIYQGGALDNSWPGGLAPSGLGHVMLAVGYFVSPDLMLSLDGRLQIISGTTTVSTAHCVPSCSTPSTGIAVLAKGTWFFMPAPVRPFVTGGIGGGSIRQVVKLAGVMDCGSNGNQQCVDTVTGGPLLLAAGGGVAYEMGALALLGTVTANVGMPNLMLNIDALLGLGLRL